jgi:hypothetical protein
MTEQKRAPRSGGRTTERGVRRGVRTDPRQFPTLGTAALRPKP